MYHYNLKIIVLSEDTDLYNKIAALPSLEGFTNEVHQITEVDASLQSADLLICAAPASVLERALSLLYLYFKVPRYASSAKLIIAYFNNDINFEGKEVDEKISKYNDFLQNSFKIKKMILQAGMDYFAYGNAFIRRRVCA